MSAVTVDNPDPRAVRGVSFAPARRGAPVTPDTPVAKAVLDPQPFRPGEQIAEAVEVPEPESPAPAKKASAKKTSKKK